MENQIETHKKAVFAHLSYCQAQFAETKDEKWLDRQIALEGVLAQIDNTLIIEYGLRKLWELLKIDLVNETLKKLVGADAQQAEQSGN